VNALYILLTTQLVALLVGLELLWREYHPSGVPASASVDPAYVSTVVYDTELITAAEWVLTFFEVVDDGGRPRVVWA